MVLFGSKYILMGEFLSSMSYTECKMLYLFFGRREGGGDLIAHTQNIWFSVYMNPSGGGGEGGYSHTWAWQNHGRDVLR